MFAEFLEALGMQTRGTHARFDRLEALLAAQDAKLTSQGIALAAQSVMLAVHVVLLQKILSAVILPPAVRVVMVMEGEGLASLEGESIKVKIAQNKKGTLRPKLINATGGPGHVDGIPTWPVSIPGVVDFTP